MANGEDKQNEQQNKAIEEITKQIAKNTPVGKILPKGVTDKVVGNFAKHKKYAIVSAIINFLMPIIIIILALGPLLAVFDWFMDTFISSEVDNRVQNALWDSCYVDESGIRFNKDKIMEEIDAILNDAEIDKESLALGFDKDKAKEYLYNFMAADLATQLPYIAGSDYEAQGCIFLWRDINFDGVADEKLEFIGYEKFKEKLQTDKKSEKDKVLKYFSIDEYWNVCIAKPYKVTIDGNLETYNLIEVKVPYKSIVSQYGMSFKFLIDLLLQSQNAEYVQAVANLSTKQSWIDLMIFDNLEITTHEYTYSANRHTKYLPEGATIPSGWEIAGGIAESPYQFNTEVINEHKTTVTEVDKITANVTYAKTWILEQTTEYKYIDRHKSNTTYPRDLENGSEPEGEGSWDTGVNDGEGPKETTRVAVDEKKWEKQETDTKMKPSLFLGLWQNDYGVYEYGAEYNPNGTIVLYNNPNTVDEFKPTDAVVINFMTGEAWLNDLHDNSVTTQTNAVLMKELIALYKSNNPVDSYVFSSIDLIAFEPHEFIETNWGRLGTGFWWPLDEQFTNITSKFGYRKAPKNGASTYHQGIDIGVPIGNKVYATADGIVELAGYGEKSGNWIKINHGNGLKSSYMHNSRLLVIAGQDVKQGDIIAYSGNTGVSTGPHLHFAIELNGIYVNPLDYVDPEDPRSDNTVPDVSGGAEAWRPYIEQAFAELGYEQTDEKVEALLRQITTETTTGDQFDMQGGYVDANTGTKINIGDGTCPWCPSPNGKSCENTNIGHGLLQFIPTTFYANMIGGHTNIYNGYDQICTCITMLERQSGPYTQYIGKGTGWGSGLK